MKIKKSLVTLAFIMSSVFVFSQDKYEFMIIEYNTYIKTIFTSINGIEFTQEKVAYKKMADAPYDANNLLIKLKDYQDKNWEVMSFQTFLASGNGNGIFYVFLRKKIIEQKQ